MSYIDPVRRRLGAVDPWADAASGEVANMNPGFLDSLTKLLTGGGSTAPVTGLTAAQAAGISQQETLAARAAASAAMARAGQKSSNMMPLLLAGAALVGVVLLMKRKAQP